MEALLKTDRQTMLVYFAWPTKRPGGHQSQLTINLIEVPQEFDRVERHALIETKPKTRALGSTFSRIKLLHRVLKPYAYENRLRVP